MNEESIRRIELQIDGLLAQYGALLQEQIRHDERIQTAAIQRQEIREAIAELREEMEKDFKSTVETLRKEIHGVDKTCEKFREEYRKDRQDMMAFQEKGKASNRMLVVAMIAGSATVLSAIIGAAAVLITGG